MGIKAVIDPNRSRPVSRSDTHSHAIGDKHRVKASFERPRQAALLMATRPLGVFARATGAFQLSDQGLEGKLCSCQKPPTTRRAG